MHDALTAHEGVTSVRERSLTLEEIFIACTKGSLTRLDQAPQGAQQGAERTDFSLGPEAEATPVNQAAE